MKLKRKVGPWAFIEYMKFKVEHPKAHKLLMKRKEIIERSIWGGLKAESAKRRIQEIDRKLEKMNFSAERLPSAFPRPRIL